MEEEQKQSHETESLPAEHVQWVDGLPKPSSPRDARIQQSFLDALRFGKADPKEPRQR